MGKLLSSLTSLSMAINGEGLLIICRCLSTHTGNWTKWLGGIITPKRRRSLCCPRSKSGRILCGWKAHSVGPRGWILILIFCTSSSNVYVRFLLYMICPSCIIATLDSEWGYASFLTLSELCIPIFFNLSIANIKIN